MKTSKLQRKFLNQMRGMGDVPWPARRFKYAPTFADASAKFTQVGTCAVVVAETEVTHEKRRFRKAKTETVDVKCGGRVIIKRGAQGRRRAFCEDCRARKQQRRFALRLEQQARRFGVAAPAEQAQEERRSARMFKRFRRTGAR